MPRERTIRDRKRSLRQSVRAAILGLDPAKRSVQEAQLAARVPTLPGYAMAESVLLYVRAFPEEVETREILSQALTAGKRVLCPRIDAAARRLRLFVVRSIDEDLSPGVHDIPEPGLRCPEADPAVVDWVLVPGLAFDARGFRLGRGGGYYDRLLPTLRREVPRWALALDCQLVDAVPVESHDVPIDGVATPSTILARG